MKLLLIPFLLIVWICLDLFFGLKRHRSKITPMENTLYKQSNVQFFMQGDKWLDHLLQQTEKATDHIHMQFYIFRDDNIGKKLLHELKESAKKGVTVRLTVDWLAHSISRKEQKSLKKAGVQFVKLNVPSFPFLFYSINERNHRKIVVIDGKYGYVGGYNVGDEYLGRDPKKGRWRDYHMFLEGAGVADLQQCFLADWNEASGESVDFEKTLQLTSPEDTIPMRIFSTNGAHLEHIIDDVLEDAQFSVFIGTPYFIPGERLKNKLVSLAKRGVKIQILIPKYPDHPLVKDAAFPYMPELLEVGVEFRQFYEGFYHAKVVTVDERLMFIGTANIDKRSFHINKEINTVISDKNWIKPVKEEIEKDYYESAEPITMNTVNKRTLFERLKEKIATAVSFYL
ncbi:cardiolipin synthase [Salipaludibacillus sp. CF4.18]|uniref:cardiolipin synthase n=1 Tax=Salipaludibacillus sp. CF4.18 TaxID=3373081 RepID=UPI003EE53308